jgi:membrane fusion protein (multidrug efflux system)
MEHPSRLLRHRFAEPLLFILSIVVLVAACISKADTLTDSNAKPAAAFVGTPVDGVVVQPGTVREQLEVTATLVANQQVDIVSELTRRIVKVNVKEGSRVRAGTPLFQLDDADLQAQLQRLRQQEKLAILNEERLKDLLAHEAIAQQDYDEAITNLKVLEAQIQEIQVTIGKTRIVAPFDGQVGIIKVYPGSVVSVNNVLTDIEDNSVVKVEFSVPEKYSNIIAPGSTHSFTIASDEKQYNATVAARAASLSENTRTLLVHAIAKNPEGRLLPGQSARLSLNLSSSSEAISVSSQALLPTSKGYNVYVSRGGLVESRPVQIGQRSTGAVEITQGLTKGDTVITSNLLRLVPGAPVQFVTLN